MINVKTKDGETTMHIHGSMRDLVADTIVITRNVRNAIAEQDKDSANEFEYLIKKSFAENIPFANEDELKDALEKAKKEKEAEESMMNISDLLKGLKNALEEVLEDAES